MMPTFFVSRSNRGTEYSIGINPPREAPIGRYVTFKTHSAPSEIAQPILKGALQTPGRGQPISNTSCSSFYWSRNVAN